MRKILIGTPEIRTQYAKILTGPNFVNICPIPNFLPNRISTLEEIKNTDLTNKIVYIDCWDDIIHSSDWKLAAYLRENLIEERTKNNNNIVLGVNHVTGGVLFTNFTFKKEDFMILDKSMLADGEEEFIETYEEDT